MAEDEKYPVWCVEPDCGIDDCGDCPFSPWNLRQKQKELEKHIKRWDKSNVERIEKLEKNEAFNSEWLEAVSDSIQNNFDRIDGLYKSIHGIAPDEPDTIKEVLRDILKNKKQNAKKHLEELVNEPQIEIRFIEACEKQIEDATRQLEKLDGEKVEKREKLGENAPRKSTLPMPSVSKSGDDSTPSKLYTEMTIEEKMKEVQKIATPSNSTDASNIYHPYEGTSKEPPEAGSARQTEIKHKDFTVFESLYPDYKVVEKADLKKWNRFVGEAVMEEEFVIDEFEEMLREISKYLSEEAEK